MTLEIYIRQKLSCPRHPRYNPEREGEAGMKGGCTTCTNLFQLWRDEQKFHQKIDAACQSIASDRKRQAK